MKIAFLNIYNGVVERGAEVFVRELTGRLYQGNEVDVFQTGKKMEEKYRVYTISGIPRTASLYHFWVFLFTLKCLGYLWKNKYDWIIPVNGRMQVIICRIFRFLRGGKILITGHSGVGMDDRLNLIFGKPDIFVALTPCAYRWAKDMNTKSRIYEIPNGVDTEKFRPGLKKISLLLKQPVILCVAALEEYKRIDRLILAVEKLEEASLLVVGSGPMRETIKKMGEEKLGSRFGLISDIPNNKMPQIYNSAQAFSLPSRESEAFGLVYLEALACNLPVVAPGDENRKTLIGKAGRFCDPENVDDYIRALKEVLSEDFKDFPRRQAEKYSWEKIAEEYLKILTKPSDYD